VNSAPCSGVWPVMLTPFRSDGTVDMDGLDALTEWYLKCGVAGLFSVCLSSEMYDLSDDERLGIASRVVSRTDGRVPVFASGTFGGLASVQGDFIFQMSDCGVNGVVLIASQIVDEQDDEEAWIAKTEQILSATNDIRLGLYECPRPYHRLLAPDALAWCAASERFDFVKDTSCSEALIGDKITVRRGTSLQFYDACLATLLFSLKHGGDGFCGIAANFYADL
jgi:4-hydroxy-tetrahydrodipicolinate synthase